MSCQMEKEDKSAYFNLDTLSLEEALVVNKTIWERINTKQNVNYLSLKFLYSKFLPLYD
jgi:hypothetical protein